MKKTKTKTKTKQKNTTLSEQLQTQ